MISLPKRETKLLVGIHGWSGILLGLLLYAVILTGMLAVFAHEIGHWSSGTLETRSPFERPIDGTVRALAAQTPDEYQEELFLFQASRNELGVFFHKHVTEPDGTVYEKGILWQADANGNVTLRREGTDDEVFGPDTFGALGRFLIDLHVRLHLPNPWGLLLTGVLGIAMLLAAVTGLLIHRHLFKDIFTLRRDKHTVLVARDRHNVAGTWSLPFAFILAFTGSFFSFASSFGLPAIAVVAFGGNQTAMFETLVGTPPPADPSPREGADLDRILADSTRRAGTAPEYLFIGNYGRADATINVNHPPQDGALEAVDFIYNGATGAYVKTKPVVGTTPSIGSTAYALFLPLHFGNFAGVISKAVWLALGFASCYVTVTGMRLWLRRREAEQPGALRWLDRTVTLFAHGLPLAIAASGIGYFLALPHGTTTFWVPASFLIAAGLSIAAAVVLRSEARLDTLLRGGTALILIGLPALRLMLGGAGWGEALAAGQPLIVGMDVALALAGATMLWALRQTGDVARPAAAPALHAAE